MADSFEIDGVKFELSPLKVEKSLELLPDLTGLLAPFLAAAGDTEESAQNAIELAVKGMKNLPNFTRAFAARCKVEFEGRMVDMVGQIYDKTFERKMALQIKWLVKCLQLEYADFLAGDGLSGLISQAENLSSPKE